MRSLCWEEFLSWFSTFSDCPEYNILDRMYLTVLELLQLSRGFGVSQNQVKTREEQGAEKKEPRHIHRVNVDRCGLEAREIAKTVSSMRLNLLLTRLISNILRMLIFKLGFIGSS